MRSGMQVSNSDMFGLYKLESWEFLIGRDAHKQTPLWTDKQHSTDIHCPSYNNATDSQSLVLCPLLLKGRNILNLAGK